jgi:cell division protein FtsI (penicillin-binding protein 3)
MSMDARNGPHTLVRSRIGLAAGLCAAAFGIIVVRLFEVVVFGAGLAVTADANIARQPMRADFVDRNGVLIARDLPVSDLYATPAAFWDTDEAARVLAKTTGADAARLKELFASKRGYVLVRRGLTPDVRDAAMRSGLPGLNFEKAYRRYYPAGRILSHAVGQVDPDDNGVSGLELGLDPLVRGSKEPLRLSFDMRVQYVLEHEMRETVNTFGAKAAGGIVLDVRTGEVLALASLPNYEPNSRSTTPSDSIRNRLTQDVYELGSIFKIFAFAQAIDEKTVRLDETIAIGKPLRFGRYTINDYSNHGSSLPVPMVFAESSNIGTAQIALRAGSTRQQQFLKRLGLLDGLKTELPEMAAPLYPRRWNEIETVTISYGQGISVNPLAFAAAAAAVVNGGTLIRPTFVKQTAPQKGERVISEAASASMRELMRLVVTEGTGSKADVPGYEVGGKTGTADKPLNGSYARNTLLSSFTGVFPMSQPQYLVFVMIDEPKGTKASFGFATGGWTAAPAVGRVVSRIAPLLGVRRNDSLAAVNP